MKRRKFIQQTVTVATGLILLPNLISCSNEELSLTSLLGKKDTVLTNLSLKKEGNSDFSYIILENSSYKHDLIVGLEAFVFSVDQTIVGFTIRETGIANSIKYFDKLNSLYKTPKKTIANDFGIENLWIESDKHIKLCYTKPYKGLEQNTHYSEYLPESKLIVF